MSPATSGLGRAPQRPWQGWGKRWCRGRKSRFFSVSSRGADGNRKRRKRTTRRPTHVDSGQLDPARVDVSARELVAFGPKESTAAYLGLVPGEATTGGPTKRRLGGITKQGNTYARALLVQSAWSILRLRSSTDPLKRWGDHIAQTRGKRIAVVALARKLSGVLWAMLRDGTLYDARLVAQESARGVREHARRTASHPRVLEQVAKNFGVPPHRRTPRPHVPRPKWDEPYGGHEPPNTQSMLRRAERCSSAYLLRAPQLVVMNASVVAMLSTHPYAGSREHLLSHIASRSASRIPICVSGLARRLGCPTNA